MAIIEHTSDSTKDLAFLNLFPDQFVKETEKQKDSWIKTNMDFFANRAYLDYISNKETFVRNYALVKGHLSEDDFYMENEPEARSFMDTLTKTMGLPKYVQNFSIMTAPLNSLLGDIAKRPDLYKIKALDNESQSEILEYKTQAYQNLILEQAKKKIAAEMAMQQANQAQSQQEGVEDPNSEQSIGGSAPMQEQQAQLQQQMEAEMQAKLQKIQEELSNFTTAGEKWGNHIHEALKIEYNIREQSVDNFRNMLLSAQQYWHIYEDNSKNGFNITIENPKNVWKLTTPDKKYTSDPLGRADGAYASGTIKIMELSEIIESFPELTKKEIDRLRKIATSGHGFLKGREVNLNGKGGDMSIMYDTMDPLVQKYQAVLESEMEKDANKDLALEFFGSGQANLAAFGYKFAVVRAYWLSKKLIGKVTFLDENEQEQSTLVDETYKSLDIPTQVKLEWGWTNQWYQGSMVGRDIYHVKPLAILDYNPIIGTTFEITNTKITPPIEMLKPFQVIYNVGMNQLYQLLNKEFGNVAVINNRRIPKVKDGDSQDDLDMMELEARERGIIVDDDSIENTKTPTANQTVIRNVDLTRSAEIMSRIQMCRAIKAEAYELIGMSPQRLAAATPTESATATTNNLAQSYTITEPLYTAHEALMKQLYQGMLDAAKYVETNKEFSTISYINAEGDSKFLKVATDEIKLRDLKIFPTNRPEDIKMFNELKSLSQAIIQNGGSIADVVELYGTNSIRNIKQVFRNLQKKQDAVVAKNQQLQQQQQEAQQQQFQANLEQQKAEKQALIENDNYNKELDRVNKREIAIIQTQNRSDPALEDADSDNVADALEFSKLELQRDKIQKDHSSKLQDGNRKQLLESSKMAIEKEKLNVERENMINDLQIAKENAKNRLKKK